MKRIYLLPILIFLCNIATINAQKLDSLQKEKLFNEANIHLAKKEMAIAFAKLEQLVENLSYSDTFDLNRIMKIGQLYSNVGNNEIAYTHYKKGMNEAKRLLGVNHDKYNLFVYSTANMGLQISLFEEAEVLLKEAIVYYEKTLAENKNSFSQYAEVLNSLGGLYKLQGQYDKAEEFYLKGLEVYKAIHGINSEKVAISLNNLGSMYRALGRYHKAETMFLETKSVLEKLQRQKTHYYVGVMTNLGGVYEQQGKNEEARKTMQEAVRLGIQNLGTIHFFTLASSNNYSGFLLRTKSYEESLAQYLKTIYFNAQKEEGLKEDFSNLVDFILQNDFVDSKQLITSLNGLIAVSKAEYKLTKEPKWLQIGQLAVAALYTYHERTLTGFSAESDVLQMYSHATPGINDGLQIIADLYIKEKNSNSLDRFLRLQEHSKSALLAEALRSDQALHFGEVPDSLIAKERAFQKKSADLAKRQIEAQQRKDTLILLNINQAKNILLEEQAEYKKQLKENYPKYHKLRYAPDTISIASLQAKLPDENCLLIEYTSTKNTLYALCISKQTTKIVEIEFPADELSMLCQKFYETLSDYSKITENPEEAYLNYTHLAATAYDSLLKPILATVPKAKHLIIIPDSDLLQIPFEALLLSPAPTDKYNYTELDYLCKHYAVSYTYSAKLLQSQHGNRNQKKLGMLGVAASYDGKEPKQRNGRIRNLRRILSDLPSARKEVQALEKLFKGIFLIGGNASEASFKQIVGDYSIVHLALHGFADKRHPILSNLAFTENEDSLEDNMLHAYEISQMNLNADLVVLSACETGYGQFKSGEGVMSLARSFMYAGVPSLVVSLWQVNDDATARLMFSFYENLAKGMNKAEALQQAKLTYIGSVDGGGRDGRPAVSTTITAHPAYWAAFIQLGDSNSVEVPRKKTASFLIWGIVGGCCLLGLAAFVFIRRKKP